MSDRLVAAEAGALLDVLSRHFVAWSRNRLRQRLHLGCVEVNGCAVDRPNHEVAVGDVIEILAKDGGRASRRGAGVLPTLFSDRSLLAIDKPAGLLSVSTDDVRERTALALLRAGPSGPIDLWPCHRLDRETSGVLLFARAAATRDRVQASWRRVRKIYLAVVEGQLDAEAGTIEQPLWQDRNLRVRVGPHASAKHARTRFRVLQLGRGCSLLEVELDTGRKHQIRAHLASLGHPVVGDDRYGVAGPRLGLHAWRLTLPHPDHGEEVRVEAPWPAVLASMLPTDGPFGRAGGSA